MAAADFRLMTEATGQRIAAALEALSGTGTAAAAAGRMSKNCSAWCRMKT